MNQILIVCLKKFGDVFSIGHLANSLKRERPTAEITLLVYKESEKAATRLRNVKRVIALDRKKILSVKGSPLFNDAHSANEFFRVIDPLAVVEWDTVVNFSNDAVSTYLSSYFTAENKVGVSFNLNNSTNFNNFWAKVYNEIAGDKETNYFNFLELHHLMNGCEWSEKGEKIRANEQNNRIVSEKFNEIRASRDNDIKIVGLQLMSAAIDKNIPKAVLREFIFNALHSDKIYPVLLTSPNEEEKSFAKEIVESIDEDIISIETDFKALPSVLLYLDALVTPDTAVKHVADLTDTPLVEVSAGSSPVFKQSTTGEDNIIIRPLGGDRNKITYDDLIYAVSKVLSIPSAKPEATDSTFYVAKRDGVRLEYLPVAGKMQVQKEIKRLFGKEFLYQLSGASCDFSLLQSFFTEKELSTFRSREKENIVDILKSLLNAIRTVTQAKADKKLIPTIFASLDRVLSYADHSSSASLAVRIFRANLDAIDVADVLRSIDCFEKELFTLKANLKTYSSLLDQLSSTHEKKIGSLSKDLNA